MKHFKMFKIWNNNNLSENDYVKEEDKKKENTKNIAYVINQKFSM